MKHTESAYINAGFKYERASTPNQCAAASQAIRVMLESEEIRDQAEARELIDKGRQEARREKP
jgi:hypothetical protein